MAWITSGNFSIGKVRAFKNEFSPIIFRIANFLLNKKVHLVEPSVLNCGVYFMNVPLPKTEQFSCVRVATLLRSDINKVLSHKKFVGWQFVSLQHCQQYPLILCSHWSISKAGDQWPNPCPFTFGYIASFGEATSEVISFNVVNKILALWDSKCCNQCRESAHLVLQL